MQDTLYMLQNNCDINMNTVTALYSTDTHFDASATLLETLWE